MDKLITPQVKAMLASWGRSFAAAVIALYSAGETDPMMLLNAGIAAVVPVIVRFFNKKDPAFGRIAAKVLVAAQAEVAKKAKAPAKKAAAPKKK
jgi:hypothetical protein